MTWSEAGYPSEQTDNPQNKVEEQSDKVYNTTNFLSKFEGNQNSIVSSCMQEIQSDAQLKEGFDNLLKSGISSDLINKIKQELKDNAELDEETLKILVQSIIAESIIDFRIGSTGTIEGSTTQAVQDKEQAVQDKEQVVRKKVEVQNNKEEIERAMEIAKVAREQLLADRPDVDKTTREKAKLVQQQLPQETRDQLKEKGYDDNFINDYILLRITLNEVKGSPDFDNKQVTQFEKGVNDLSTLDVILKNIDNACNTADTNLSSFNKDNFEQTKKELFHDEVGNKDLIEAKKNNMKSSSHEKAYDKIFSEMGEDDMFKEYGKFLDDNLKKYWDKYKDNYSGLNDEWHNLYERKSKGETLTQEEEEFLKIKEKVNGIKESMDEEKKNMMEELCIISQIKGMYMCMGEGDNFDLNKSRGIRYDEEGAMILDGYVDGVAFSIRQDINNPEARLQTSQKFAKLNNGDVFSVGGKDNFVDSNFILPSQNEIFQVIAETVQSDESLADFDNQSDYITNLQTNIMGKMEKKYENTKYVHHYMEGQVKGEKIADKTLGLIGKINPSIINDTILMKNISPESNNDLYNFMKILKFNIDNSTNTEKDNLNQCITKILEITNYYADSNGVEDYVTLKYPPIIDNYLKNKAWLNGGDGNSRLNLFSNLFGYYSKKSEDTREGTEKGSTSKVMINDLYRDLFESNNGNNKSQTAVKRETEQKLNSYRKEAENQSKKADQGLMLDDDNIWKR